MDHGQGPCVYGMRPSVPRWATGAQGPRCMDREIAMRTWTATKLVNKECGVVKMVDVFE